MFSHLRFPEFTGEWEKHKLSDVCSFFSGGTPSSSKKEYYDGSIPFIRSGELHMDKTKLFITEEGFNNSAAKIVEIGDLLLALYGATSGDIAISQIKGAINQAILCIRTTQNKKFIESVWKKHVEKLLQTYLQGGQGNLSADIVKNISFYFANSSEQMKLANFISLLDDRIATQNKIIEDLKKLKSAISTKIFSNCKTEVQLSDVANVIMGQSPSSAAYNEENYGLPLVQGNLDIGNGKTNPRFYTSEITQIAKLNDVILTVRAPVGEVAVVDKDICIGRGVCAIRSKDYASAEFIYQFLIYYKSAWNKIEQGSTFTAISGKDIRDIKIPLPHCVNVLTILDKKTTLEKNTLRALNTQKQYLLYQMFI